MITYKPFSEIAQEEVVVGHDDVFKKYVHLWADKYKGLKKYNLAFV